MRLLAVTLTETAIADLDQIADYIEEQAGSPQLAMRYVERIRERCLRIGNAPHGGRKRDDLMAGMRTTPFERSALICYLIENDIVVVTNIFHRGRDVELPFRDSSSTDPI